MGWGDWGSCSSQGRLDSQAHPYFVAHNGHRHPKLLHPSSKGRPAQGQPGLSHSGLGWGLEVGVDLPDLPLPQELAGYTGGDVSFLKEDFELQLNKQIVLDTVSVWGLGVCAWRPALLCTGLWSGCAHLGRLRDTSSPTLTMGTLPCQASRRSLESPLVCLAGSFGASRSPSLVPVFAQGQGVGGNCGFGGPGLGTIGDRQQPVLTRLEGVGEGTTGWERHHGCPAIQGLSPALHMAAQL